VTPDTVRVEVQDSFDIDVTASADTVCVGESATLTANITPADVSADITWTQGGSVVGTGDSLVVSPSSPGSYTYVATGSNACGTAADSVTIRVLGEIQVDAQPDTTVCLGETAMLTAMVTPAGGASSIEWTLDGDVVGNGGTLLVSADTPGSYVYVATASGPCNVASDSVIVQVLGSIQLLVPQDTSICAGDNTTLTAQVIPSDADATIVWTLEGDVVGNTNELVVSQDSAGSYIYVATATGLCNEVSDSVTVTVIDSLQIDARPDSTILLCAPVQEEVCLSATADGMEDDLVWVDADGNILDTGAELCVLPPIGESLYIATLPDHNCAVADTVRILVDTIPPPPPIFADSTKVCLGDTAVVDVEEGYIYPFVWLDEDGAVIAENEPLSVAPDTTGNFEYIIRASNGCGTVQDTAVVTVVDSSAVEIVGGSMTFCTVDTAVLTANWTFPECVVWTDIEGTPLDTGAQIVILPTVGTDTIIAQLPGLDCVVPDTVTISFLPPPSVDITLTDDVICEGDTAVLTAEVLPPSSTNFVSWYDADFNFLTDGTTLEVSPEAGEYTYIAVAENACGMDTAFADLQVERLDLELIVTNDTICPDESATLEVAGCEDCTYVWTPEDGLSAPDSAITVAEPTGTTTYTVEVSGQACVEELAATITVIDCPECMEMVFVADAFTPNGDGNNDSVCLRSNFLEDFEEVEFMIYNRWGEELFRSTDIKNMCWDGKHRNKQLPPDVYGYFLRVKCPGRDAVELKGNITLLR
jgi:gliding motility-associated-like protein